MGGALPDVFHVLPTVFTSLSFSHLSPSTFLVLAGAETRAP